MLRQTSSCGPVTWSGVANLMGDCCSSIASLIIHAAGASVIIKLNFCHTRDNHGSWVCTYRFVMPWRRFEGLLEGLSEKKVTSALWYITVVTGLLSQVGIAGADADGCF